MAIEGRRICIVMRVFVADSISVWLNDQRRLWWQVNKLLSRSEEELVDVRLKSWELLFINACTWAALSRKSFLITVI